MLRFKMYRLKGDCSALFKKMVTHAKKFANTPIKLSDANKTMTMDSIMGF